MTRKYYSMKNYTFFTLLVLIASVLGSCEIPDVDSSREEEILKSHKWRRFSYTENGVEKLEECMKDDIYEFFDDGTANVIRFNLDHRVMDTIFSSGTFQEFKANVLDDLQDLVDLGFEDPKILIQDTIHVDGGVRYVRQRNIAYCTEDYTGYDTPILNWHYEGEQKSFTFRHDFSLKVWDNYYPAIAEISPFVTSPEDNIIPVDYDITFIEDTEFHVKQKLITQNTDGTLNEEIFVTKFQAEPDLGEAKIVISL